MVSQRSSPGTADSRLRRPGPNTAPAIAATLERVEDMNVATLLAGIPWDFETFPEYLASVARRGVGLNFANYLGHTPLRLYVMGDAASERPATAAEIDRMAGILRDALQAGAAGFAVQLLGHPSRRRRPARAKPFRRPFRSLTRSTGPSVTGDAASSRSRPATNQRSPICTTSSRLSVCPCRMPR